MVNEKIDYILEKVSQYSGKTMPLIRCLTCFDNGMSDAEFDALATELIRQKKIVITVDDYDYVRYSPVQ